MKFLISTTFPDDMRLRDALSRIKGLGKVMSLQICDQLGISQKMLLKSCFSKDIDNVTSLASSNYVINNELMAERRKFKGRLRSISAYRALRASKNLPCRGQRTRSNARTCRRLFNRPISSTRQRNTRRRETIKVTQKK